ncbi:hypothetical protein GCM10011506_32850 [Marivirga lumbricoides]|uniref:Uncharacterized protein n=1 Tax=Marivirga lumbricoides TaxID=1046115 RepID=A0ABQ1MTF5_9BACT|nr:hypothetical protein GCM10011506_32850 [Marivirga lumbricoides]
MFSEEEIAIIISNKQIDEVVAQLKKEFIESEARYLKIKNHDFLAIILLSPEVGKKMANQNISLGEEMSLQKKARKYSKGGFFLSKDPVVDGLKYLIKSFPKWEDKFYTAINKCLDILIQTEELQLINDNSISFESRLMRSPYFLVRFISSLFLESDEEILQTRKIKKDELEKLNEIGEKVGLGKHLIFKEFMAKYELK